MFRDFLTVTAFLLVTLATLSQCHTLECAMLRSVGYEAPAKSWADR